MSPLLFLAIALVVPLMGMIVLGVGARIRNQKITDDETGPFRRRLESIAPLDANDAEPSGTPGLVRAMRRRRRVDQPATRKPSPSTTLQERPTQASIRLVERDYSVPLLPPMSADLDDPPPESRPRSRRAIPRPPAAARRHDRVISPSQRRRSGS
ncbi:hypothetical protein [Candidatus Poriferisodalis sp.]|uniref:hypothetical protein n=1 Tax=Candidatus Poriferisodalis sp. TaxID=3101277 RepID=UPI003B024F33